MTENGTLQRLADIIDCLHRSARGMDRHDRDLARTAYHDDAVDDHAGFTGSVEEFLDRAFGYRATTLRHQHHITNHHIDLDGDTAHVESYFLFVATLAEPASAVMLNGGRYVDGFERRDGRWAIAGRVRLPECRMVLPALPPMPDGVATTPNGRQHVVARDRTDTSYLRPLIVGVQS
jgi:hypothetical protein